MKKRMSIMIDEAMYRAHGLDGKNASKYINEILKEKFMESNKERLVQKMAIEITDQLVGDELFLNEVASRLNRRVQQTTDWGA